MPHRRPEARRPAPQPEVTVRAERFRAALQARILGRAGLSEDENYRAILVDRGEVVLRPEEGTALPLTGPVMAWFPWRAGMRLELGASAQGTHLLLGQTTLNRVLQRRPDLAELRFMAERPAVVRLSPEAGTAATVAACFAGILDETLRPGPMAPVTVEAFLHVILVHLHRGQPHTPRAGHAARDGQALAQRFTALVEGHFRDRWTVARYAAELGVSRDRLGDICLRAHGRAPAQLIRERVALEARIYLESSTLAPGQIAGILGFASTPQFNRFFRTMQGRPPGRWRADRRRAAATGAPAPDAPYAWP
ncbi:MAG TPA: AraC family transcriptional regulator [Paracoccaceae bacterium]|nr:AraC family transcriptional regulator [Paracoccaceae bacterium]